MNMHKPLLPQGAELTHPPTRIKVYVSLILAFALTLLPWSETYRWLVPDFTLMALLYWNIRAPRLAGLGAAFGFGLLSDVARGVLIGLNALAFCAATFVVLLVQRRLAGFDATRQTLQLAPILLGKELLVLAIGLAIGRGMVDWRWLAAGVVATLLWSPLAWLVDRITGRASAAVGQQASY
jgi:rod shape-determining protein MreD